MEPYICSEGFVTIGLGTKLHKLKGQDPKNFPITVTRRIAEEWLDAEVYLKTARLTKGKYGVVFNELSEDRQAIIISMAYQMGVSGVEKFQDMWAALDRKDWYNAEQAALDSNWARQTPSRAIRHASVLRGYSLEAIYGKG